ncbi:glycine--tRNA ligase subunit beta [Falsirhodobacter sp. 20TX0035]|uniref:glycine--tRNA ligase subunit beta n=1 Tax=Falsirhodobacter sp. 20TX0035 TaxID=3022019 RepID=UPI00232EDDCA|nr:glycine--tRNA ligase subunit beta [Falsirhodobacter sp. 20TX0035]MDB6454849.1 glycine--tRNA ligase subunit beta [Falsirhodobacter sp. 20TX0035]
MPDLLLELFSEEIPARMQARARADLQKLVTDGLVEAGLTYASAGAFSTPRRLVLAVEGLTTESPTVREERKGPKADAPEQALAGFLRGLGITDAAPVMALAGQPSGAHVHLNGVVVEVRDDKKGQILFAKVTKPGRPAAEIVAEVVERTIRTFPWPKSMRWGSGQLRWVRPLHSILCLLTTEAGSDVVPVIVDHLTAGNTTEGHRFMAPGRFAVSSFDDYRAKLAAAHVVLDSDEREAIIWNDATTAAFAQGLEVVEDKGLLAEVAGLVECPVVLMGTIGEEFLGLPPEVLQTSMKEHQKFFSVKAHSGRIEKFVTVANRTTRDDGATILKGNQKVLSARLSDARFFWDNDLRTVKAEGLEGMGAGLSGVTFHNRLGSQADRVARIADLAERLAPMVGADAALARQAAQVAKADLQSDMVGEFPELQGLMGRYYATAAGLDAQVAEACQWHYSPLGPSDVVPVAPVTVAVALADKIDTLTGFWSIDEKPTGSKDPFALRRAALGVIRLVLGNGLRLPLADLVGEDLLAFFHDRLKVYLRDQGVRHDVIDASIAMPGNDDLALLVRRAEALQAFLDTEDGTNLLQGFRRANNILNQAEAKDGVEYSFGADPKFAEDDTERALFTALDAADARIRPALGSEDFAAAMSALAGLRGPIDAFFEAVQVNAENPILRRNRLNLLHRIRSACAQVADLTKIGD